MPQSDRPKAGRDPIESLLSIITESDGRLAEIRERQAGLRGVGTAADGRVVAEVLSTGGIASLVIDPRAMRLGAEGLAEEIVVAFREASRDVSERVTELIEPCVATFVGGSDQLDSARMDSGHEDIEQVLAALRDVRKQFGL